MMQEGEDYVYDEVSGEWLSAADLAHRKAENVDVQVRDAVGNPLVDGDSVTLVKDLTVKGANQTLKRGTVIKSIRLTGARRRLIVDMTASRVWCCAPNLYANVDPLS